MSTKTHTLPHPPSKKAPNHNTPNPTRSDPQPRHWHSARAPTLSSSSSMTHQRLMTSSAARSTRPPPRSPYATPPPSTAREETDPGERHTPAGGRDGDKAARPDSLAERSRRHHRGPTAARASHVRRGAHHTPPRAKTRHDDRGARGMATAGSRSLGRRSSTPSPEFTGRPMPGLRPHPPPVRHRQRTRCAARNPRGKRPHTRGGRPRPPLPATMERQRSNAPPGGKRAHRAAVSYRAVQRRHCVT